MSSDVCLCYTNYIMIFKRISNPLWSLSNLLKGLDIIDYIDSVICSKHENIVNAHKYNLSTVVFHKIRVKY